MEELRATQSRIRDVVEELRKKNMELEMLRSKFKEEDITTSSSMIDDNIIENNDDDNNQINRNLRGDPQDEGRVNDLIQKFVREYAIPLYDDLKTGSREKTESSHAGVHIEIDVGNKHVSIRIPKEYTFHDLKHEIFDLYEIPMFYFDKLIFTNHSGSVFLPDAFVGKTLDEYNPNVKRIDRRMYLQYAEDITWMEALSLEPPKIVNWVSDQYRRFELARNDAIKQLSKKNQTLNEDGSMHAYTLEDLETLNESLYQLEEGGAQAMDFEKKIDEIERATWRQVYAHHTFENSIQDTQEMTEIQVCRDIFFDSFDLMFFVPAATVTIAIICVFISFAVAFSFAPLTFYLEQKLTWFENYRGGTPSSDVLLGIMMGFAPYAGPFMQCEDTTCTINKVHKIITSVRIHQIEIESEACELPELLPGGVCYPSYSSSSQSKALLSPETPIEVAQGNPFVWTEASPDVTNYTRSMGWQFSPLIRFGPDGYFSIPNGSASMSFTTGLMFDFDFWLNPLFSNSTTSVQYQFSTLSINSGLVIQHNWEFAKTEPGGYFGYFLPRIVGKELFCKSDTFYGVSIGVCCYLFFYFVYICIIYGILISRLHNSSYRIPSMFPLDVLYMMFILAEIGLLITIFFGWQNEQRLRDAAATSLFLNYEASLEFVPASRYVMCVVLGFAFVRVLGLIRLTITGHHILLNFGPLMFSLLLWTLFLFSVAVYSVVFVLLASNSLPLVRPLTLIEYVPKFFMGYIYLGSDFASVLTKNNSEWLAVVLYTIYVVMTCAIFPTLYVVYAYQFSSKECRQVPMSKVTNPFRRFRYYIEDYAPVGLRRKEMVHRGESSVEQAVHERERRGNSIRMTK